MIRIEIRSRTAIRLPAQHIGWETPSQRPENNPQAVNLGGLFSFFKICEQSQQKHADHDHFCQRKLHEHHLHSGGDTSPPKSVVHWYYIKICNFLYRRWIESRKKRGKRAYPYSQGNTCTSSDAVGEKLIQAKNNKANSGAS